MQPPPLLAATPGKVHFLRGSTLNEMMAAVRKRTPLPGTTISDQPPKALPPRRFDPGKVYRVTPTFWSLLETALSSREPTLVATSAHSGFTGGAKAHRPNQPPLNASGGGLDSLQARLKAATPKSTAFKGPQGYRLPLAERPRGLVTLGLQLEVRHWWAEAFYCYIHATGGVDGTMFASATTVDHYENGGITTTVTAEGGPVIRSPSSGVVSCAEALTETDPAEPDYEVLGAFESQDETEYGGPFEHASLLTPARGAVEYDPGETASATIRLYSAAVGGISFCLDGISDEWVRVWFDDGIHLAPATPPGGRLLSVSIEEEDTTSEVATKLKVAIDADTAFTATVSGAVVSLEWSQPGPKGYVMPYSAAISVEINTVGGGGYFESRTWLSDTSITWPESIDLAQWISIEVDTIQVNDKRYRWRNTGSLPLRVEWSQGGGSHTVDLAPLAMSDFYGSEAPATEDAYDQLTALTVEAL